MLKRYNIDRFSFFSGGEVAGYSIFCSTFVPMKKKKVIIIALSMLMVLPVYSQDKRYHGDGIDDVLRFVPTIAVFGLKACGVEAESTWQRRIGAQVLALGVNAAVTYSLKHAIHEKRPDRTDNYSFPSGHTSFAFSGATVLMHEYRKVSSWIGVAGYAVATTVAVDRVRRNRHHWGDVMAGAAIGVASAEAGYLLGDWLLGKKKKKAKEMDGELEMKNEGNDNLSLSVAPTGIEFAIKL